MSKFTNYYKLSNLLPTVHYEKNIVHTDLGLLFNKTLKAKLGLNVVVSSFMENRDWFTLSLKIRGVQGGHFGLISRYQEDLSQLQNPFCIHVWQIFLDCTQQLQLPSLASFGNGSIISSYHLNIELIDFDKSSQIGFFMDNIVELQQKVRNQFPNVPFFLRFNDDDQYFYYLIFENKEQQKLADEIYGIPCIIDYVYQLCQKDDVYGVFENYHPYPIVTDKESLKNNGKLMGIMRNNTDFSSL